MDKVGRNKGKIAEYIRNQLQDDYAADPLTLFEEYDPLTGKKNKKKWVEFLKESASKGGTRGRSFRKPFRLWPVVEAMICLFSQFHSWE